MKKERANDPLVVGRMLDGMFEKILKQQASDQVILTGWKDICKACGIKDFHTMRRWAQRYRMPYVRMYGHVTIARVTLIEWVVNLCKTVEGGHSEEDEFVKTKMKNLRNVQSRKKKVL